MKSNETILVEPSLFAADFGNLSDEAKRCEDAGADAIHFDIMDGHFVKNLSLSPKALAAVNRSTELFLDVHIMVYTPLDYVERLVECGADRITFHLEATEDIEDIIKFIKKCNVEVGLALCPETTPSLVLKFLDQLDLLLLMTVNPGFGGQDFLPEVLEKIKFIKNIVEKLELKNKYTEKPLMIQVDGGINYETAKHCVEAGANNLVSGSFLFKSEDMALEIDKLKELGSKGTS